MNCRRHGIAVRTLAALLLWTGAPALAQEDDSKLGLPSALVVDPADPAVVYAGFFELGLFKTTDGGNRWFRITGGLPGQRIAGLALDPFVTSTVYVVERDNGIFKSDDGGLTWRSAGFGLEAAPGQIRDIVVDPDEPLTLYAPTARGLFRSLDGAESFELLRNAPADPSQVLFHPLDSVLTYLVAADALSVSDDFGETWKKLGQIGAATRQVAIDPFRPELFYAATENGVLASVDGGRAWAPAGLGAPAWSLAFDATGALLATTDLGLLRLDRLGDPWLLLSPFAARELGVHPFDPRILFLADRNGEVVSSDQGGAGAVTSLRAAVPPPASLGQPEPTKQQESVFEIRVAPAARPENPVAAIAVDPVDPAVVYAGCHRGVFRSTDYGEHWEPASRGLELLDVHSLAVDPDTPSTLYAGTHGAGLFRSLDGGRTWSPARHFLNLAAVAAIAVDPLEPSVLYAGGRGGLYTSRDRARTWKLADDEVAAEVRTLAFPSADPLVLMVGTAQGRVFPWGVVAEEGRPAMAGVVRLARYERRDELPEAVAVADPDSLAVRDLAVDPDNASVLHAATVLGPWRSADTGLHWAPDEPTYNVTSLALDPADPSVLYAGTTEGLLRRSEDRWSRVKIPGVRRRAVVYSVEPAGTVIYAGLDDGRVAVSRDAGQTWAANRLVEEPGDPPVLGTTWARRTSRDVGLEARLAAYYAEMPAAALRRRAHLALERALRGSFRAHDDLEKSLREIRFFQLRRGEEELSDLRFSADSRWLLAAYRFDDGVNSHSETRLYDVHGLRLRSGGLTRDHARDEVLRFKTEPPTRLILRNVPASWPDLGDIAHEPEHLHPGWVIADPGDFLAWSPDGRYLATRSDADVVSVWRIVAPPRPPESPFEPRTPDDPPEQRLALVAPGLRALAWSAGGRYLAVAGPRGIGTDETVVYLTDVDRTASGTLDPLRTLFQEKVTELRFTPESRWLWIRSFAHGGDLRWGHLVPRKGRWALIFARDGDLWRVAPESRLHVPLPDAPEAFTELAASPDGRWLAGRPAAADGSPAPEVLLWYLDLLGPTRPPHALPAGTDERGLHFSSDSLCLGLEYSAWRVWELTNATASVAPVRPTRKSGPNCRGRNWLWTGSGGVLEWPTRERPERPPDFDVADEIVFDGWGSVSNPNSLGGRLLKVWRNLPESGWETVDLWEEHDTFFMSPDRRWVVAATRRLHGPDDPEGPFYSSVLRLWDLESERPARLEAQAGRFGAFELHDDERDRPWVGREVVHWDPPESGGGSLFDRACQVLGRNLTREEWRRYAGNEPYKEACEYRLYDRAGEAH